MITEALIDENASQQPQQQVVEVWHNQVIGPLPRQRLITIYMPFSALGDLKATMRYR